MDIYAYGESINFLADYYDHHTGLIYALTEYRTMSEHDKEKLGIPVYENGSLIGYAKKERSCC